MNSILETTSSWLRPHLTLIAFTFVCTLLVLYGNEITRFFKQITRTYPLWVRVLVFMMISGIGYGWATSELTVLLKNHVLAAAGKWLFVWVLAIFIGLGILADRRKQV